jgi:glucose/arabinose dehydrogenase
MLPLSAVVACVVAVAYVGYATNRAQAFDTTFVDALMDAKPKTLLAVLCGLAAGMGWGLLTTASQQSTWKAGATAISTIVPVIVVGFGLVMAWETAFDIENIKTGVLDESYEIEELAKLDQFPIRLAIDDDNNRLFISSYSTSITGVFSGTIFSLMLDRSARQTAPTVVATSPALYRPFGMAYHDGVLYVSRAGHSAQAVDGKVHYASAGAVTELRDLNGDGRFEFLHDVLTGIPAARGPDTMHQNNGIAFDQQGTMYVAIGSSDNRSIDEHPWSGTVVRVDSADREPSVFASGLRNPFGICVGPGASVFVTDNDSAEDPGDEVNYVVEGEHYGHPYAIPGTTRVRGFQDAILVGKRSNYCGVAYIDEGQVPGESGSVFVCDRLSALVVRLRVKFENGACKVVENRPFAKVPGPVDIVASRDGDLYVASIQKQKLYRIRRK